MRTPDFNLHGYIASFRRGTTGTAIAKAVLAEGRQNVMLALMAYGADRVLNDLRHQQRTRTKKQLPADIDVIPLSTKTMRAATTKLRTILDVWFINGVALGNVSKADLLQEADDDERQGQGKLKNAEFYRALAQRLSANQKVSQGWSAVEVEELKNSVWN